MNNFEQAVKKQQERMNEIKLPKKTADKMFEEIGYDLFIDEDDIKIYRYWEVDLEISFELNLEQFMKLWGDRNSAITIEEHLAIHQKLIELGWLD